MKRKQFLAMMMSLMLVGGMSVPSFAAEVPVGGDTASGTVDSQFIATADMLGGGLVVSIPADLNLTYDAGSASLKKEDFVTVKGSISATKRVDISVAKDNTWSTQAGLSTLNASGTVTFAGVGETNKDLGDGEVSTTTVSYSASEVRASNNQDKKTVNAVVATSDIPAEGTYNATVKFHIQLADAN